MREKDVFKKKAKNSVIYFQFGLIATMLLALYVLEFNFQDVKKKEVCSFPGTIVEIDISSSQYEIISDPLVNPKPTPKPPVKVVTPQKVVTEFEVKDNVQEVESNADIASQDNKAISDAPVEISNKAGDVEIENVGPKEVEPTFVTVEQLPLFKACVGLSRAEQKACFEAELSKVVSRHLVYPEEDFEDKKQGRAFVEFIINEKGEVTNVSSLSNGSATEEMKKAAERAVKRVPKLIPAQQGKKNVKIKYVIPISFKIN